MSKRNKNVNYKVAPERRFEDSTDEWKKRLRGDTRLKRRKKGKSDSPSLKVKHLLYIAVFFVCIMFIPTHDKETTTSDNSTSNQNTEGFVNCNIKVLGVQINNKNKYTLPPSGYNFVNVDVSVENNSDSILHVSTDYFDLQDSTGHSFTRAPYYVQPRVINDDLSPHSTSTYKVVFDVPNDYNDSLKLYFNGSNT